jgi:hypothetical protein
MCEAFGHLHLAGFIRNWDSKAAFDVVGAPISYRREIEVRQEHLLLWVLDEGVYDIPVRGIECIDAMH